MKTTLTVPGANGNSASALYLGGAAEFVVYGSDFDSGTVTLQVSYDDGTTWINASSVNQDLIGAFSANGGETVWFGGQPLVRVVLSGSSGTTVATCELHYGLAFTRDQ